ncbi:MAG: lysophospholipid acyltransferase family protein [Planctomycetota bacterium]
MRTWVWRPCRFASRVYFALFHRLHVEGTGLIPRQGPVLFLGNHASFLDPPLVGCTDKRKTWFLARSTLGDRSWFGWFLQAVGVEFVDREGSARAGIAKAIELLKLGRAVCMFPEGRRSDDGSIAEFRAGAQLVLRKAPATVVPFGVRGTFDAWPRTRKLPRPRKCAVHFGAPMTTDEFLADGGFEELRRRVAALADRPLASPASADVSDPTSPGAAQATGSSPVIAVQAADAATVSTVSLP